MRTYLIEKPPEPRQIEALQKLAAETVGLRYSLEKIAGDFIDFYYRLGEE